MQDISGGVAPSRRKPVTVLTGALGAGKTTLVSAVLSGGTGRKVGLIVNEVGEVSIDGQLLATSGDRLLELSSGCLCCSAASDLRVALMTMAYADVDHILIETTGLADPGPVVEAVAARSDRLRLDAVICVVDARSVRDQLADHRTPQYKRQIELASTVVVSKADVAGAARVTAAREQIAALNADARVVTAVRGDIPAAELFDLRAFAPSRVEETVVPARGKRRHRFTLGSRAAHPEVETVCAQTDRELDLEVTMQWLQGLMAFKGPDLNRVKGILAIAGLPHAVVIHGVLGYLESAPGRPWADGEPRSSAIVAIGHGLDQQLWQAALEDCAAITPAPRRQGSEYAAT
ncbi:MAG: GTP-binding protein [Patulibacter sp.]